MILIFYDGSDDARAAIAQAATLMPGHPAVALTVWWAAAPSAAADPDERDGRAWAERTAAEGAQRAHRAGIDCAPRAVRHTGPVAEAVLDEARRSDARAIVVGRGGGGDPGECGLGPVAAALLRDAACAVLVAGPAVEAETREGRHVRTGALA
jgi:nucleotide-binding universal stress UspA family protein